MTTRTRLQEVENRLKKHGVRFTHGRRAVVEALRESSGPKSAAALHTMVSPQVPMSSLYRTLTIFVDCEIVAVHFSGKGLARYELAEWLTGHHHHLLCINCGSVDDIEIPPEEELKIQRSVEQIGAFASFIPSSHALEIEGRCAKCL